MSDGSTLTVTPDGWDGAFIEYLLTRVNLNQWSKTNQIHYAYLALASDRMWQRVRRHKASELFNERRAFARDPRFYRMMSPQLAQRELMLPVHRNAIELLEYEAWRMIHDEMDGEPPLEAIEKVRPDCLDTPRSC